MTVSVYIACRSASSLSYLKLHKRAHLHGRFLSQQLDATFVALKLQLQNRICKPGVIFSAICRRDIAGVSNMFKILMQFCCDKNLIELRDKNRLCKRALRHKQLIFRLTFNPVLARLTGLQLGPD